MIIKYFILSDLRTSISALILNISCKNYLRHFNKIIYLNVSILRKLRNQFNLDCSLF